MAYKILCKHLNDLNLKLQDKNDIFIIMIYMIQVFINLSCKKFKKNALFQVFSKLTKNG